MFGVGNVPAVANLNTAIASSLAKDSYRDIKGITTKISSEYLIDNGAGELRRGRGGKGTINYNTGEITMNGCPRNSEFVVTASIGALGGSDETPATSASAQKGNTIGEIYGRSLNKHVDVNLRTVVIY